MRHSSLVDQTGHVRQKLKGSRSPVALTGAGVSAESGVPTFRGTGGLWRSFRAEDLATPGAFSRDPVLVWEWYNWRRELISRVRPNTAHYALAELEKRYGNFTLITQNVDGLHTLAGSSNVLKLHGSIWRVRCIGCGARKEDRTVPIRIPPLCSCGFVVRPDVVWFGEGLPQDVMEEAFEKAASSDFMLVIGTSGVVQPAASLALRAKEGGAMLVEINPDETPLSPLMDVLIREKAAVFVPKLL